MRVKIARIAAGAAIAAGVAAGFAHQEARASTNTVWLWKDVLESAPPFVTAASTCARAAPRKGCPKTPGERSHR